MDFNVGEIVTQKTKELVEKIILEFWYNTLQSVEKYVTENKLGRSESTATMRGRLYVLVSALKLTDQELLIKEVYAKETKYDRLFEIFLLAQKHLQEEGILNYESEKSYHSTFSDQVDKQQKMADKLPK